MAPDLSIIVVSWNTRDLLRDCLASIPAGTDGLTCETLVVDNASADGTPAMVRAEFPDVRLIESGGNLGFSRGNNLALPAAQGRAVLLLNPDTICPPGSLRRLRDFLLATPDAGVVGPTLVDAADRPVITYGNFPRTRYHWLSFLDPQRRWLPGPLRQVRFVRIPAPDEPSRPVEYVAGACLMIRREALDAVGPLDERFFMYFEETDWCLRVRRAGWRVYHCADSRVVHLEGRSAEQVGWFSLAQFQKSYRLFVAKHYGERSVPAFRAAQFCEYGLKGILRAVAPWNRRRNAALSRNFLTIARLQLASRIDVRPPA